MSASWDGFTYFTNDPAFIDSIQSGKSEPYDGGYRYSNSGSQYDKYNVQIDVVKRYIEKYPGRNRVMVDIGAHIGTTMLPYSRIFSSVYGFEPNKESYELCVKNIKHNNSTNCFIENVAISNKRTTGIPVQHSYCNTGCFYFKEDNTSENTIATKILDEDTRMIDVDFIKIDTEGAEYYVILGALTIIKTYKPLIQAEMNGLSERNFGIPQTMLLDFMNQLGYSNIHGTDFFYHKDYIFS